MEPTTEIPPSEFGLASGQSANPNLGFYLNFKGVKNPQPIRGGDKAPTDPGPQNKQLQEQNTDAFAPPGTDTNDLPNAKWPMALSPNRHGLENAGWARQQNIQVSFVGHQIFYFPRYRLNTFADFARTYPLARILPVSICDWSQMRIANCIGTKPTSGHLC